MTGPRGHPERHSPPSHKFLDTVCESEPPVQKIRAVYTYIDVVMCSSIKTLQCPGEGATFGIYFSGGVEVRIRPFGA